MVNGCLGTGTGRHQGRARPEYSVYKKGWGVYTMMCRRTICTYINHIEAKLDFNTKILIWKKFSRILITL